MFQKVSSMPDWVENLPPAGTLRTELKKPAPARQEYGPFLRFGLYSPETQKWVGSALVILHQEVTTTAPTLKLMDLGKEVSVEAMHIFHFDGFNFWRFDLEFTLGTDERGVKYHVEYAGGKKTQGFAFALPGKDQQWRWGFHSCNGFHEHEVEEEYGGIQPLWVDVLARHKAKPMHVLVGGGDQLYNDHVWELPTLLEYLSIPEPAERRKLKMRQAQADEVAEFYMYAYLQHWTQDKFVDALATIPQLMAWDDHDIFDGWGSYPDEIHRCGVFQGIFHYARLFYALFQQHATPGRVHELNGTFGGNAWHTVTCFGKTLGICVLDARTERSRAAVVPASDYVKVQQQLAALPSTVRHVVFVTGVPLIYPHIPGAEGFMHALSGGHCCAVGVRTMIAQTGVASSLLNSFDQVELLDDLVDHWSSAVHKDERMKLLHMLQELAQKRSMRVTFLAGDVHVAAWARFASAEKTPKIKDFRYMPQIISSAIGNGPPPFNAVRMLQLFSRKRTVDANTDQKMMPMSTGKLMRAQRNWAIVEEAPLEDGSVLKDGALTFQIRLEHKSMIGKVIHHREDLAIDVINIKVEPLLIQPEASFDASKLTPFGQL